MKTKSQPQYTQGTLEQLGGVSPTSRILDKKYWIDIIIQGQGIVATAYGRNQEETQANADRMITAMNTHDECIKALKYARRFFNSKEHDTDYIDDLLKQLEL